MQQLTDDDLLIGGSNHDEKERITPPDMPSVRQARLDFSYFMSDELRSFYLNRKIFSFILSGFFFRAELLRRNQMLTACANLDVAAGEIKKKIRM
jgi:hypothetical protein